MVPPRGTWQAREIMKLKRFIIFVAAIAVGLVLFPSYTFAAELSKFGLGIHVQDHQSFEKGVIVVEIDEGSPSAGKLRVGDIINKINDEQIEGPDLLQLYLEFFYKRNPIDSPITFEIERGINQIHLLPQQVSLKSQVAYHGGTFDYKRYNSSSAALLAGISNGATYKFGPEVYCVLQFILSGPSGSQNDENWIEDCTTHVGDTFKGLQINHPGSYQTGEVVGGLFFNFNDLINSKDSLKKQDIATCLRKNITGAGIDAAIWQMQDGFWGEASRAIQAGRDTSFINSRLQRDAAFAVFEGTVQCLFRGTK